MCVFPPWEWNISKRALVNCLKRTKETLLLCAKESDFERDVICHSLEAKIERRMTKGTVICKKKEEKRNWQLHGEFVRKAEPLWLLVRLREKEISGIKCKRGSIRMMSMAKRTQVLLSTNDRDQALVPSFGFSIQYPHIEFGRCSNFQF